MATDWRLMTSKPPDFVYAERAGEAAWNMACDETLLDVISSNSACPVLRLYFWRYSAITIGRFQTIGKAVDHLEVASNNLPVIRRMTGGRGILHGHDLTITIVASLDHLGLYSDASVIQIYDRIATGYHAAFELLGIPTTFGACAKLSNNDRSGDCFVSVSRADIVDTMTGMKVLGSAIYRRGNWVLQQASIPFRKPEVRSSLFQGKNAEYFGDARTPISDDQLLNAIRHGFHKTLGLECNRLFLSETEVQLTLVRMREKYLTKEWNEQVPRTATRVEPDEIDSVTQL